MNSSPGLQVYSLALRRPLHSAHRCSVRGAWVSKCWTPTAPPSAPPQSPGPTWHRAGEEGAAALGILLLYRRAPWPINRLFEFPPRRACHVSISEGLFLLPVRLFGSRGLSHISFGRALLSGARQTVLHLCVRACAKARTANFMFSAYSLPRGER